MPRDYKLYLEDLLEAITKIETYTEGTSFEYFKDNGILVDAVLHNLEIIGESAKHIPESIRVKYPEVE
jgi:uncharacterized protein with HEPN domain